MASMYKFGPKKELWISFLVAILVAALMASLDGRGRWIQSYLVYLVTFGLGSLCIFGTWKVVKATPRVTAAALVSFALRLGIGVALALLLPVVGYSNNVEQWAGYVYTDAYNSDNQRWRR